MSVFEAVLAQLPACSSQQGEVLTLPFLDTCRLVLPVIESLGAAFTPARADVSGNIERLAARAAQQPETSVLLFDIVRAEVADGAASGSSSCTKGLLWLKRFLEFTVRMLERLANDPARELSEAVSAAYDATLRSYHGYVTGAVFSVLMRAAPYRATFERALVRRGSTASEAPDVDADALRAQMKQVVDKFTPLLSSVHVFLADAGLDDQTPV